MHKAALSGNAVLELVICAGIKGTVFKTCICALCQSIVFTIELEFYQYCTCCLIHADVMITILEATLESIDAMVYVSLCG